MDGWMDGSTVHAQGTPSYTVYGPEALFFLFCLFATTSSPLRSSFTRACCLLHTYLPYLTVRYMKLPTSYIRSGLGNTGMT